MPVLYQKVVTITCSPSKNWPVWLPVAVFILNCASAVSEGGNLAASSCFHLRLHQCCIKRGYLSLSVHQRAGQRPQLRQAEGKLSHPHPVAQEQVPLAARGHHLSGQVS